MSRRLVRTIGSAIVAIAVSTTSTRAQDAQPADAGMIQRRSTACMLAKYNRTPPCPLPELGDGSDPAQTAVARVNRAKYFIDMGDLKSAFAEADEALKINPGNRYPPPRCAPRFIARKFRPG
jgi:hypothetical protein